MRMQIRHNLSLHLILAISLLTFPFQKCKSEDTAVLQSTLHLLSARFNNINDESHTSSSELVRVRVSQFHMGMMVHLTLWAESAEHGEQVARECFLRIKELTHVFSDYEPQSELERLCRRAGQGPVSISKDLHSVLAMARHYSDQTDGIYDPTIGPLSRLWRESRESGLPPSSNAINERLTLVNYQHLLLAKDVHTAELTRQGMKLDLGGIAKGFVGDEAM
jgi:FAD:protein FMN transferase